MAYPPDYRYFSASDKQYVKNYGCTCIGVIVVLIFFGFLYTIPSIIRGDMVFVGDPISFVFMWIWMLGPFVALGVVIKLYSQYREKKEQEKMLADSEE